MRDAYIASRQAKTSVERMMLLLSLELSLCCTRSGSFIIACSIINEWKPCRYTMRLFRMEALVGSLALAISSAPSEHGVAASPVVASGMDACGVMVQAVEDPPDQALVMHEMVIQGAEEQVMVDVETVTSCFDMELSEMKPVGICSLEEPKAFGAPSTVKSSKELIQIDVVEPLEGASSSPWGEFLEELALTVSSSPQNMQMEEAAPSLLEQRSFRLDKKNKDCDISVAKRAEYRRAEAFGEVPTLKSKGKASEEILNEKMQHYLQMYKKQHTPQVIEAVRALVKTNACTASSKSSCVFAELAEFVFVGYKAWPRFLGLGALVSGTDDVP